MIDFEDRVKDLLNEHVDEKVGPRRTPAPFRPSGDTGDRRHTRWLLPLVAAACVAAVTAGTVGVAHLLADGAHNQPGTNRSTVPQPQSTAPLSPTASTRPFTPSTTPRPHPERGTHEVRALGATLVLPDGWAITGHQPVGAGIGPSACIGITGDPALQCPISLSTLVTARGAGFGFDVDQFNLGRGDQPTLCNGKPYDRRWSGGERTVGGRAAEYRSRTYVCHGHGGTLVFDQYAVITKPGYLLELEAGIDTPTLDNLIAHVADRRGLAELRAVADRITRDSALPAQDAPLRLFDRGIVHSTHRTGDTVTIELQRVMYRDSTAGAGYVAENPGSYVTYNISTRQASLLNASAQGSIVGSPVHLTTDGTRVLRVGHG